MKMSRLFRRHGFALFTTGLLAGSLIFTGCKKDDNNDNNNNDSTYTISGNASGAQEVPAVTTSATATLTGEYMTSTGSLQYVINWTGLSDTATAIQFHGPAEAGVNADPIVGLTISTNDTIGVASGTIAVPDSLKADLLAGKWYYNIHTDAYPDGEIRGQVSVTAN